MMGKFRNDGKHFVEGGAEVIGVGHRVEVVDPAPGAVEVFGGVLEGAESVFKGRFLRGHGFDGIDVA